MKVGKGVRTDLYADPFFRCFAKFAALPCIQAMNRAFSAPVKSKNPMKKILPLASACLALSGGFASAVSLMLDFGPTTVTGSDATLSPGHDSGVIPAGETSWNSLASSASTDSLVWSDGNAASGITLTLGRSAAASTVIDYTTAVVNVGLAGSGGAGGRQNLVSAANSIYGGTAPGRDAFFGAPTGSSGTSDSAIGLRLDGLAAGQYTIYTMARNTNTNGADTPMTVYVSTGTLGTTFDFSTALANATQSNIAYFNPGSPNPPAYTDEYSRFIEGENYIALSVTIAAGESLFLAVDGASSTETRGFLNMVQVVQVPEPSIALLGAFGFLALFRRRR